MQKWNNFEHIEVSATFPFKCEMLGTLPAQQEHFIQLKLKAFRGPALTNHKYIKATKGDQKGMPATSLRRIYHKVDLTYGGDI